MASDQLLLLRAENDQLRTALLVYPHQCQSVYSLVGKLRFCEMVDWAVCPSVPFGL